MPLSLRPTATSSRLTGRTPCRETLRVVEGLTADPGYAQRYGEFQRLMVYGEAVDYAACMGTLRDLADRFVRSV
jgi:hypothetical protein